MQPFMTLFETEKRPACGMMRAKDGKKRVPKIEKLVP
jgi:hypothetical protein